MIEKINELMPSLTTITAILAPVLVAIINNRHQYKIKKMELEQKSYEQSVLHKREIFENFLSAFNKVCQIQTIDAISEYSACYSLVYIFLPKPVRDELGKINLLIKQNNWEEVIKYVDRISMDIAKELEKLPIKQTKRLHIFCKANSRKGM